MWAIKEIGYTKYNVYIVHVKAAYGRVQSCRAKCFYLFVVQMELCVCTLCALHPLDRNFRFFGENLCRRLNDDSDMSIAFTLLGTVIFECATNKIELKNIQEH